MRVCRSALDLPPTKVPCEFNHEQHIEPYMVYIWALYDLLGSTYNLSIDLQNKNKKHKKWTKK
jgi:hypothetical protein